jgi:hypothetical protein
VKYIYVAGPFSGEQMQNIRVAMLQGAHLLEHGLVPFVPHLSGFWDVVCPLPYDKWLEYDLAWLERCDALYRLQGASPGADREVARAEKLGIPVFYAPYIQTLLDACGVSLDN